MLTQESILKAAAEAAMNAQPGQDRQTIPPQPVPLSIQMMATQGPDGSKFVVLVIHHFLGESVYHFTPEGAEQLSEGLKKAAGLSKTGLILAH